MLSYKSLRRLIFYSYFFLVILFVLILIYLGKREIDETRKYTEKSRIYIEKLLECRKTLNNLEHSFNSLAFSPTRKQTVSFSENALAFRRAVNHLAALQIDRVELDADNIAEIKKLARLLDSIASSMKYDFSNSSFLDASLMSGDACRKIFLLMQELRPRTFALISNELNNIEYWQQKSIRLFEDLKYILLFFFIMTGIFTIGASAVFSNYLRKSILKLNEGTREVSEGNLDYRFKNSKGDEIGSLMRNFNTMAIRLKKQTEELKHANSRLRLRTEELLETHMHKDRFLANMSHELRTPLNSIIGFSELMIQRADKLESEKITGYSEKMLNSAEHLLNLISDLLDVAKADAGVMKPQFREFRIDDCVRKALEMFANIAEKKGLKLKTEKMEKASVYGDAKMITQILVNIIGNAVKYTDEGLVKIKFESGDDKFCIIDVSDTGTGMSDEDMKSIFKDFYRGEKGLTAKYDGTGIGLTLSRRLLELHGGKIIVKSIVNKGSNFIIKIPWKGKKDDEKTA